MVISSYLLGSLPGYRIAHRLKGYLATRVALGPHVNRTKWGQALRPALQELPTVAFNTAKGMLAVGFARALIGTNIAVTSAGLAVVTGHIWPFFGAVQRQKGISTAAGVMLLINPAALAAAAAVWVAVFGATRYASVSSVVSFGALPVLLYLTRRRDVYVIYGILLSAMAVFQMAGDLARISEGKAKPADEGGDLVGLEDEDANEEEPVRKKKFGLRVGAIFLGLSLAVLWFANKYVYRGFGLQIGVVRSGSDAIRCVALTFDDGPDPRYTPQVLDILKSHGVKATFFLVGRHVEQYPGIARRIAEEGHSIGNHSYSHLNMILLSRNRAISEIERSEAAILKATGERPYLFRPPRGLGGPSVIELLRERKYTMVLWSLSSRDWIEPSYREIVSTVLRNVKNGDIILFHDSGSVIEAQGGSRENTVRALPIIISELKKRGYRLVTVDELIILSDLNADVE